MRTIMLLACAGLLLGGCAANPWEETFEATALIAAPERPTAAVTVREVPWQRLDAALTELEAQIAADDLHPDEWPAERKEAVEAKLLKALQLSEPPETLTILGRSDFSTTSTIDPRDGSLAEFAAEIGADYAIWSRIYQGKTDRIVTEPVTTWSDGTLRYRTRDGKRRTETVSGWSTTYVPVVVAADEWAWLAYFVRKEP